MTNPNYAKIEKLTHFYHRTRMRSLIKNFIIAHKIFSCYNNKDYKTVFYLIKEC